MEDYADLSDIPRILLLSEPTIQEESLEKWHNDAVGELLAGIRELRSDHKSGARELATRAVVLLVSISETTATVLRHLRAQRTVSQRNWSPYALWWDAICRSAKVISRHGRPSMGAAITTAILDALNYDRFGVESFHSVVQGIQPGRSSNDFQAISTRLNRMKEYLDQRKKYDPTIIGTHLWRLITYEIGLHSQKIKILTLSCSSTIQSAITTLLQLGNGANGNEGESAVLEVQVKLMESRPLCEGTQLAKTLVRDAERLGLAHRLRIEIASDASVAHLARNVDVVLLGADRISEFGDISNKTGSLPAVLCARAVSKNVSVIVVSGIEKIARSRALDESLRTEEDEEENNPEELTELWDNCTCTDTGSSSEAEDTGWREMVVVRNTYFEWVAARHIDWYISDEGKISKNYIAGRAQAMLAAEQELFGEA
ncbi:cytokinesis protein 3 [Myotisia sp. PD_48]|nr:cytokinesis protein 3 [Myotisia sp. PD_48]